MKTGLINEILRITKLQTSALGNEDIDEFTKLIEEKQICIEKINQITNGNPAMFNEEERALLTETLEIDKMNREEFDRQYEDAKIQLCKIRSLKKRDNIYSNPYNRSYEEGIFIDKK